MLGVLARCNSSNHQPKRMESGTMALAFVCRERSPSVLVLSWEIQQASVAARQCEGGEPHYLIAYMHQC
jgi:hypothetical protein